MKILSVFGTRPEAIKMAPVIQALQGHSGKNGIESITCVTAQHREMLDQVLHVFGIQPDVDLNLMRPEQTLSSFTALALPVLTETFLKIRPDMLLVQGDTTTAMVAALAAFYARIPTAHVEAGLRTRDIDSPFPEEMNRKMIGVLAKYHFAPTRRAVENLKNENVPADNIYLTGNTVIDALLWVVRQKPSEYTNGLLQRLRLQNGDDRGVTSELRTILVTAHRRENFGAPFENICNALLAIAQRNPKVQIVYPVHLNPHVRGPVHRILQGHPRIHLIEPLSYEPFAQLMKRAVIVITDSGGIQEEAPALGKPVLVIRRETERPEAVEAGCVKLVGTETEQIIMEAERLLYEKEEYERMARAISPYGDGQAARRIVDTIMGAASAPLPVLAAAV